MKIAVVYIYTMIDTRKYFPLAMRFANTWREHPPGCEYELYVVGNGMTIPDIYRTPFLEIPNCKFYSHDNTGWDIGAYQLAAEAIPCDLLVCLGSPVHFHRAGWLDRMAQAYIDNGPGLYGCWAYLSPNWHVRTTVFWLPPDVLNSYPVKVGSTRRDRYEFEHGSGSLTRHVLSAGMGCYMVTWKGVFPFSEWGEHGPTWEESLVLDQHTYR